MRIRSRKLVAGLLLAEIVLGPWIFFAPTELGGSIHILSDRGGSMQPLLYKNDLALVRAQTSYRVGDVVLYHSAGLGKPVLHRVILIQNGQYYFKGDNNNFVDPGYATRSELVGKLWVHVPQVGVAISWLGHPLFAGLLAGLASVFVVMTGRAPYRRRRRRSHHALALLRPPSPKGTGGQR